MNTEVKRIALAPRAHLIEQSVNEHTYWVSWFNITGVPMWYVGLKPFDVQALLPRIENGFDTPEAALEAWKAYASDNFQSSLGLPRKLPPATGPQEGETVVESDYADTPGFGVTPDERQVVDALAAAFNMFGRLPKQHDMDAGEFCRAIHSAQYLVLKRPGVREMDAGDPQDGEEGIYRYLNQDFLARVRSLTAAGDPRVEAHRYLDPDFLEGVQSLVPAGDDAPAESLVDRLRLLVVRQSGIDGLVSLTEGVLMASAERNGLSGVPPGTPSCRISGNEADQLFGEDHTWRDIIGHLQANYNWEGKFLP